LPVCHGIGGYTLTITPPHTLPYYTKTQHPPCPLSQTTTIGGGPPPSGSIKGVRWRNLRLAHGSADSVCLRADCCLHHGPPRPHTLPRTHTTPLHATTLHSHLLPAHTTQPHSHLCFDYKYHVWGVPLGLASVFAKNSATLHNHSTHSINTRKHPTPTPLGNVYTGVLIALPFLLTKERSTVGRALAPYRVASCCTGTTQGVISLMSLFDPLFKQSRLHCFDVRDTCDT